MKVETTVTWRWFSASSDGPKWKFQLIKFLVDLDGEVK